MAKSKINWPDWVLDGSEIDWRYDVLLNRWHKTFGNTEETVVLFCKCYYVCKTEYPIRWSRTKVWNAMMDMLGYTEVYYD